MKTINILTLLTTKDRLEYLDDTMSLRQAIEKMKVHHYTNIPVIKKDDGTYIGTLSEGDLMWNMYDNLYTIKDLEEHKVLEILKKDRCKALKVSATYSDLLQTIINQNFVPIVDDRNVLMGIITRKSVINQLKDEL